MRLEVILLGVIQGLTEWLPISSTGHLRLAEILLGLSLPLVFDIILHVGTLAVTVFFFRAELKKILSDIIKSNFKSEGGTILLRIIVGSIPTAIIGIAITFFLEEIFRGVASLAVSFLISSFLIYISKLRTQVKDIVDYKSAVIIGLAQGFSIIPGLSRSGLTISVALILGIKREEAFKFSFLLSIPAISGALIVMVCSQFTVFSSVNLEWIDLLIGVFIAMCLGYISLRILRRILHKFHVFAFYSLFLGLLLIAASVLI
ncbi:MAG: undecaprenyl-diphosphate phosphatase [Candidatus Bathyarchaeia archaeon]